MGKHYGTSENDILHKNALFPEKKDLFQVFSYLKKRRLEPGPQQGKRLKHKTLKTPAFSV